MRAPENPAEEQALNNTAELVIKGMMNVAKADGQVSADEIQRIVGKHNQIRLQPLRNRPDLTIRAQQPGRHSRDRASRRTWR
jgi:hypothetical protein